MLARFYKRASKLLTLTAALIAVTPVFGKETLALNFGVSSSDDPTAVVRKYMPALKELEISMTKKLDQSVDIRMHIAAESTQGADYLDQGIVDFASLSNEQYMESKLSNPGLRILAGKNAMNSNQLTPWVARAGMQDSIFIALRESLFGVKNTNVLTSLRAFGFVQSHDAQYSNSINEHAAIQSTSKRGIVKQAQATKIPQLEPRLLGAMEASKDFETIRRQNAIERKQNALEKQYR